MAKQLIETVSAPLVRKGKRWLAVVAAPGQGQNGNYSADILRAKGPAAIPAGTKSWLGHTTPDKRNLRDLIGTFPDGAYYDDDFEPDEYPEGALIAELEVKNSHIAMIEDIGEDGELSIYMHGDTDADGNVTDIYPARSNSVDLVGYAGLSGSRLKKKLYESYKLPADDAGEIPSDETSAQDKKEVSMDKEIQDKFDALTALVSSLVDGAKAKTEADTQAEIQAKVDAELDTKLQDALSGYDEKVALIDAAELLPSMVESLKAEARKGVDVKPLIESAKAVVEEAKKTLLAESVSEEKIPGYTPRVNDAGSKPKSFTMEGIRFNR